ncbi:MAG TPA: hypothetical protein VMW72_10630 [Sedimentisphaerales bacterium]|nr:hypothetical protein [Sedimentisphaerales bacterium]
MAVAHVKFNKTLTNLQGKVNAIIRKDGRLYQIKTNATESLVVDPINNTATFLSKANLNDRKKQQQKRDASLKSLKPGPRWLYLKITIREIQ